MAPSELKLYALPGSHPCDAVVAAIELKGIPYRRIDLIPLTQLFLGPILYGGVTVPGMRLDGERTVGSRAIMRRLDALRADPALLPAPGEGARERVLEAERWGDEVFQGVPRRIIDVAFLRDPKAMLTYAADAGLPIPDALLGPSAPLVARLMALRNRASEASARADIAALPGQLERIDGWIDEGLLGGELPSAADLQIGSTIRLLLSIADLRALIEPHPAATLSRYFPPLTGEVPAGTLPAGWLGASPQAIQ